MTNLVQRLREMSSDTIGPAAANRIQWLEAERDELSQLVTQANKRIKELERENAKVSGGAAVRWNEKLAV